MGTFHVTFEVGPTHEGPFETVEGLVDTGASFTMVPATLLGRVGVQPSERQRFKLADGSVVMQGVAEAVIRLRGRTRTRLVIFGPDDAPPLLGADTLEGFRLWVDPDGRQLIESEAYLAEHKGERES